MASTVNDFGSASNGLDRAEIHKAPPIHADIDSRPSLNALQYEKPSVRHAIGENFLSLVVHPRYGWNKLKATIHEKKEATERAHPPADDSAPTLAPTPLIGDIEQERLVHDVDEKPKIPAAKQFLRHPITSLQETVQDQRGKDFAENVMKAEISHGVDVHTVRQADKVTQATDLESKEAEKQTLVQMKQLRQDAFVRWTVDRHVRKVVRTRLVHAPPKRPPLQAKSGVWSEYAAKRLDYELEEHAEYYLDNGDKFPQPDRKLLASCLERFVIALTPFQDGFMWLRSLSHWEHPRQSACYMVLYLVLLMFSQLTRMIILFIIGRTIYRRWYPPDIENMRKMITHSESKDNTAQDLIELVTQYGDRGWVDHVIDKAGPAIFDWLERGADILEIMQNFHAWRNPSRTRNTICALLAWWLLITLTPTAWLVKMSFFGAGFDFFVMSPLSVRYPKYRVLTSPWTWLMWEVPTHAEWAIARLQAEARAYLAEQKHLHGLRDGSWLIARYGCTGDTPGELVVTTTTISFNSKDQAMSWSIYMQDLKSMQKITEQQGLSNRDGLTFVTIKDKVLRIQEVIDRDSCFSQIIGYSCLNLRRTG